MVSRFATLLVAAASILTGASAALAAWPEKPIKVIVPFGPGGTTDVFARIVQRAIEEDKILPQPVTIVNVGGHFSVGSIQVKNAAPDGYTFLLTQTALLSSEVMDPARKLSYRDFDPVALTGGFCLHHVVREDSPYKSLKDMVAAAKEKPGTVLFGVNMGGLNHMGGGFLEKATGAKFRFVQIGGGAENYAALKGNQVQATMLSSSEFQNFQSGGMKSLGYTGPERLKQQPDVPTVGELGYDYQFCINNLWFAPKGTPKEAIAGMTAALKKAMASKLVVDALNKQASSALFLEGEAYSKALDKTFDAVAPVAKMLGDNSR